MPVPPLKSRYTPELSGLKPSPSPKGPWMMNFRSGLSMRKAERALG